MDLYLDSVDFKEIEAAFSFGFVKGLTTTPTFMHRHGITDIDGAIVKLSRRTASRPCLGSRRCRCSRCRSTMKA
jgi:transaldolase